MFAVTGSGETNGIRRQGANEITVFGLIVQSCGLIMDRIDRSDT